MKDHKYSFGSLDFFFFNYLQYCGREAEIGKKLKTDVNGAALLLEIMKSVIGPVGVVG